MTIKKLFAIGWLMTSLLACQAQELKITFRVTDDFGKPIKGTTVGIAVFERWDIKPGEGFGEDIYKNVDAITDTNGVAAITANSLHANIGYGIHQMPSYYHTEGGDYWFKKAEDGRWQPWNPTVELVLKPVVNPVTMYHGIISDQKIPVEGKPVGFDLMKNDWVAPYGKGATADFVFQLDAAPEKTVTNWYGTSPRPRPVRDNKLTVSFSSDGDGIQTVLVPKAGRSELRLPRQAPTDGYEPVLVKHDYDEITGTQKENTLVQHHSDFQPDGNYFFRVRTKRDAQGNIVSALYGEIYGDFNAVHGGGIGSTLSFSYHLNPTANSQNMEFDPQRNLLK
jgi:hypothetical protein